MIADLSEIADPFLVPSAPGYLLLPRQGTVAQVALPLVASGQITARLRDEEGGPVANTRVTARACAGGPPQVAVTDADGRAYFENVALGCVLIESERGDRMTIDLDGEEPAEVDFGP